ncbi:LuxR family transcriptional regulator [Nonomuraea ferruginea]
MQKTSLEALVREHLKRAAATPRRAAAPRPCTAATSTCSGRRSSRSRSSQSLAEHENPGEATLQVLRGRVRLHSGGDSWDGMAGDLLIIPPARHSLDALEDAACLLTVAKTR